MLGYQTAAQTEVPVEAVEVRPRRVLPRRERPGPRVVALSVLGLLRETHREVGEPKAAIGPLLVTTPSTGEPEAAAAVRDRLPVSTVAHLYMAAGPEQAAVVLLEREELVASGVLILRAAAGLLGPRTGTPEGLAEVTHSVVEMAAAVVAEGQQIRMEGPAVPVVPRVDLEVVELRVVLVPGRVV